MTSRVTFLLVGQAFTQAARAVIALGLPQRAFVELRAEPDNPYDAQAVRVLVSRDSVTDSSELDEALAAFGLTVATVEWPLALGHLGAKATTKAAKAALQAQHTFALCETWHRLAEGQREVGRLVQYGDGTVLVEVEGA